jgi:hypothetical protein
MPATVQRKSMAARGNSGRRAYTVGHQIATGNPSEAYRVLPTDSIRTQRTRPTHKQNGLVFLGLSASFLLFSQALTSNVFIVAYVFLAAAIAYAIIGLIYLAVHDYQRRQKDKSS